MTKPYPLQTKSHASLPDFDFLMWVRRVFFFKQDAYDLLVDTLHIDPSLAWFIVASDAFKACDLIQLYHDTGRTIPKEWDALMTYLLNDYNRITDELRSKGVDA